MEIVYSWVFGFTVYWWKDEEFYNRSDQARYATLESAVADGWAQIGNCTAFTVVQEAQVYLGKQEVNNG